LTGNQPIEEGVMGFQLRRYKNKLIEQGFLDEAGCWVHKKGKGAVKNTVVAGKPALLFELFIFFDMVSLVYFLQATFLTHSCPMKVSETHGPPR
jgi:hypothetical protein